MKRLDNFENFNLKLDEAMSMKTDKGETTSTPACKCKNCGKDIYMDKNKYLVVGGASVPGQKYSIDPYGEDLTKVFNNVDSNGDFDYAAFVNVLSFVKGSKNKLVQDVTLANNHTLFSRLAQFLRDTRIPGIGDAVAWFGKMVGKVIPDSAKRKLWNSFILNFSGKVFCDPACKWDYLSSGRKMYPQKDVPLKKKSGLEYDEKSKIEKYENININRKNRIPLIHETPKGKYCRENHIKLVRKELDIETDYYGS